LNVTDNAADPLSFDELFKGQWDVTGESLGHLTVVSACRCSLRGRWGVVAKYTTKDGGLVIGGLVHYDDIRPWIERLIGAGTVRFNAGGLDPAVAKQINDYLCAATVVRSIGTTEPDATDALWHGNP
jgi:hypothetical protein